MSLINRGNGTEILTVLSNKHFKVYFVNTAAIKYKFSHANGSSEIGGILMKLFA